MQVQFHKKAFPCLQRVKGEVLTQEQTQELRLPEDMPDIGSVLGVWGQVLIRGKEWHSGGMDVSCGVMAWVMYRPEDGSPPQMAEAWIPFQFKWDVPNQDRDGKIMASCLLRSVDARVTSARKLMLRATVSTLGEAWIPDELQISTPDSVPDDICLLKRTYPCLLPREAGEKTFSLDEELTLPASAPKLDKLLRFSLHPELIDRKVLSSKVAFRGVALAHILYSAEDGSLHSWDFELPLAQYAELEQDYEQNATARIAVAVTSLEMDANPEGRLHLLAGMTGQYLISDRTDMELVEDAYSPGRNVAVSKEELTLPAILDEQMQTFHAEQGTSFACSTAADVAFYPDQPKIDRNADAVTAELSGQFQLLYYDQTGQLQGASPKWHGSWSEPADPHSRTHILLTPSGIPKTSCEGEAVLSADMLLDIQTVTDKGLMMVTDLELGDAVQPDPSRPSLILRRTGNDTLWEIAKATGSTEEAIRIANHLEDEPGAEQMLIIPVQ